MIRCDRCHIKFKALTWYAVPSIDTNVSLCQRCFSLVSRNAQVNYQFRCAIVQDSIDYNGKLCEEFEEELNDPDPKERQEAQIGCDFYGKLYRESQDMLRRIKAEGITRKVVRPVR